MSKLRTLVDPKSEGFKRNAEAFEGLLLELRERSAEARRGGGEKAQRRHKERGKLLVRDRIELLLDPGTAFLELSPLAAYGMYDGKVPAAGIVTGVGRVLGREVVIVANDEHALAIVRSIMENLNAQKRPPWTTQEPEEPIYDPEELYGIVPQDYR